MPLKTTITLLIALSSIIIGVVLLNQQTTQAPKAFNAAEPSAEAGSVKLSHSPEQASDKPYTTVETQTLEAQPSLVYHEPIDYDLPGELIEHLDELFERYHSGDLKAGYVLAMNLRRCNISALYNIDSLNELLSSWDLSEAQNIPQEISAEKAAAIRSKTIETFYYCKGVSIENRKQGIELLEAVADQGFVPAQYEFGHLYEPSDLSLHKRILSKAQFEETARRFDKWGDFINNAARHGHLMALKTLSEHYRKTYDTDLVRSLAYGLTFLHYANKTKSIEKYTKVVFKLKNEMTPIEVEQAQNLSETLIKEIIKNGTVYEH